jgi:hypothetical protein
MQNEPSSGLRVNSDDLTHTIDACNAASTKMFKILQSLRVGGQSAQEWAGDAVSLDIADHYTRQLWAGAYCTYSTLHNYQEELLAIIDTLQQTLANYSAFDGTTAASLEQL